MATKKPQASVKARVLMDGAYGQVNDVIEIQAAEVQQAEASGQVDAHPDAVAYAEGLKP